MHAFFRYLVLSFILAGCLSLPAPAAGQGKTYRIGPDDVLTVIIYAGGEKQFESSITVSNQGNINAPFIGSVKAEGLTPSELEKRIQQPLALDYFVDPKVNIQITQYRSLHYYISGGVNQPGLYTMTSEVSLLVLIAKAGGLDPDHGNVAFIMRGYADAVMAGEKVEKLATQTKPIKVDLYRLLNQGDLSANPMLNPGDVVYIPMKKSLDLAESKIYVEGEVKNPGAYDYQAGLTALSACIMAGGFDTFAAPNRAKIIREKGEKTEVLKINLEMVKEGKIPDVQLQPGDRIHIPETWL